MKEKKESNNNNVTRRNFLRDSVLALAGLSCLSFDLRAALKEARLAGKPLLTEKSINALIQAHPPHMAIFQRKGREAARDVKGFLKEHFYFTPTQQQELEALSPADVRQIQEVIRNVVESKGQLKVVITGEERRKRKSGETDGNSAPPPMVMAKPKVDGECSVEVDPFTGETKLVCKVTVSK